MEPLIYQPEGDAYPHEITADVLLEADGGITFIVRSDGEEIGEVDVEILHEDMGFVSGVGPGERINNGYLRPASMAIAACLHERDPRFRELFDINNEPIVTATEQSQI